MPLQPALILDQRVNWMAEARHVTVARLVSMIDHIYTHPGVSVRDVARYFGLPVRKVRKDVLLLDGAGFDDLLPGRTLEIDLDLYETEDRLRLFSPLDITAPLALSASETSQIALGLTLIAETLDEEERRRVPGTLAALMGAADSPLPELPVLTVVPLSNSEHFLSVQKCVETRGCINISYTDAAGKNSSRTIWPTGLSLERDGWLVEAWCGGSGEKRLFRLDRIGSVATCPPGTPKPKRGSGGEPKGRDPVEVDVLLSPDAQWVLAESVAATTKDTKNGIEATYHVYDEDWFIAELISLAPYVRATNPSRYLAKAQAKSVETLALWDALAPQPTAEMEK